MNTTLSLHLRQDNTFRKKQVCYQRYAVFMRDVFWCLGLYASKKDCSTPLKDRSLLEGLQEKSMRMNYGIIRPYKKLDLVMKLQENMPRGHCEGCQWGKIALNTKTLAFVICYGREYLYIGWCRMPLVEMSRLMAH